MDWRYTGQQVLGYGASGAGIGTTIAPGIGTAIGAGAGSIVGLVAGLLGSDEEEAERSLAEALMRGEISPDQIGYLERALSGRFGEMRRDLGGQIARRGLADSSIAGRLMAKSYDNERSVLADALVSRSFQRQMLGHELAGRRDQNDAAIGAGITNTVGQIVDLYDARGKLAAEQERPVPNYLRGPSPVTRRPIGSLRGSGGSQPKSLMPSPGSSSPFLKSLDQLKRPSLVMNPSAGRSGNGQMSRL